MQQPVAALAKDAAVVPRACSSFAHSSGATTAPPASACCEVVVASHDAVSRVALDLVGDNDRW